MPLSNVALINPASIIFLNMVRTFFMRAHIAP